MKTGIFGGSFDPVHEGHIRLALSAAKEQKLDRLIILPTGIPPHKAALSAAKEHRLKLLEFAVERMRKDLDIPVMIDDRELKSNVINYTYVTLEGFHRDYPDDEFYFIMGGDSIEYFKTWVKPEVIATRAVLLAGRRKDVDESRIEQLIDEYADIYHADVRLVGSPEIDISSSKLREILKDLPYGKYKTVDELKRDLSDGILFYLQYLSDEALNYIFENRVYSE